MNKSCFSCLHREVCMAEHICQTDCDDHYPIDDMDDIMLEEYAQVRRTEFAEDWEIYVSEADEGCVIENILDGITSNIQKLF